jgi:glycosyltransferase involved in cell wall biosynthesis
MPTYNQENLVAESIESVLNQSYDNWELIIGDDCSTDKTYEILKSYEKRFPNKIKAYRNEKNFGITANCNKLLKRCIGKYIAFTAGDDLFLPNKVLLQVKHMEANPQCLVSYHDVEIFDSETGKVISLYSEKYKPRQGGIHALIKYGCFNCGCANFARRDAIPISGYDKRVSIASDWLLFVETLGEQGRIEYIDKVLGKYRRHAGNVTSSSAENTITNRLAQEDHFMSCSLLVTRYPECYLAVRYRLSSLFLTAAVLDKKRYFRFILISFLHFPTKINIGALLLYLLLGKKI